MLKHTGKLRNEILSLYDESYSRVKHLKDSSKGKTAYVLASGPSFSFYSKKFLNEFLKDKRFKYRLPNEKRNDLCS